MQEIPHSKCSRNALANHCGCCRSHHAPPEQKNENRVKNQVDNCSGQGGHHGKPGTSIGANDGIHGLTEHIKWNSQCNGKEIFLGAAKCFVVDCASEHVDKRRLKDQIYNGQDDAACNAHDNGVSNAAFGKVCIALSQIDAHKRTTPISHHNGNGQRHHCERENHRVGGVSIGAKIAGICDKDLIDNVIKCTDQQ